MAQAKRESARERLTAAKTLMLGLPPNMSVEGAHKMEELIAYLYDFRAATFEQLARCLPHDADRRVRYWLDRYDYIRMGTMSGIHRYDMGRKKWIAPRKLGVYTLSKEARLAYEIAEDREADGYEAVDVETEHKPQNVESMIQAIELYTRVLAVSDGYALRWVNNQTMSSYMRGQKILSEEHSLNTIGFIGAERQYWGVGTFLKKVNGVMSHTKKTFLSNYKGYFQGIMLVRNEYLGMAQKLAYKKEDSQLWHHGYYRFVPYEFSLEHPKWFLAILRNHRWAVLDAVFDNIRLHGGVVERVHYSRELKGSNFEAFQFRVTHGPDEFGRRRVEYVDTSYGAMFSEIMDLLLGKTKMENGQRTLYVADSSEIEVYKEIAEKQQASGIEFRIIDWPGGK